ncbi:MAG: replication initiation protein [Ktedonobacteraceae bacterium]|nr:replication initiation protein [Ktedonobacteraceae bacterium]
MRDENGQLLAVMSNPLLRRKLSLDVMQQHIFHMAVGEIEDPRDEKEKLPVFHISVDAYAAMIGRSARQGSLYQQLKTAVRGLQHAEVALPGGERIAILAPYAEYVDGESRIEIDFNERLKPYILGLRKYFAKIPVAEACKLRSGYAISFYLYCWSWYGSNERGWSMTVSELREWLAIGAGTFERTCDLKMRVIEQSRQELNAKASITFNAKPTRHGRKTVGWFFEIKDNKPKRNKAVGAVAYRPLAR